jgi:hypothetical protein
MGKVLELLRKGFDPIDAHEMAQRVHIVSDMLGLNDEPRRSNLDFFLYWALHRWDRSGCPVFTMAKELAWAIANTEPPMTTFDLLPEIPVDGMYVSMPPVFDIGNDEVGRHRIEGFFLTVNDIYVPKDKKPAGDPIILLNEQDESRFVRKRGITIVGVGEDKAPDLSGRIDRGEGWNRDDWVVYFSLVPGEPLYIDSGTQGVADLTRVVANFLYLLQNTTELREDADPPRPDMAGADRKARRERERQHRKGRSACPHRVWHLSTLERNKVHSDPDAPVVDNPKRKFTSHMVLGHIHRYWVLNPTGRKSLGTREVNTKTRGLRTYHLVARWLLPYVKGEGPLVSPRVLVR